MAKIFKVGARRPNAQFYATYLILLMGIGCVRGYTDAAQKLAQNLSQGDMKAILDHIHPEYSDHLGDREELKRDLEWFTRNFDQRRVSFAHVKKDLERSSTTIQFVAGELEAALEGEIRWKYTGPLELEFVDGIRSQLRSGLMPDLRDVHRLMDQRRAAVEQNDSKLYQQLLHPKYERGDENHREASLRVQTNIQGKIIRLQPQHYTLEVRGALAHLTEWSLVLSQNQSITSSSAEPLRRKTKTDFTLKRSAGSWRIARLDGQF